MAVEILNEIRQATLLVTTMQVKRKLLRRFSENKEILPIKFMTLETFLSHYFFRIKRQAYLYLKKSEKKKISILEEEIDSFPLLTASNYQSEKLNHLKSLLIQLEKNNLLEKDTLFDSYIRSQKIIVYGYDLDPFYQRLFEEVLHARVLKERSSEARKLIVYRFSSIEEEIGYIGGEILKKVQEGVPFEKIKIISLSDEYRNPIRRIFSLLHIPIELGEATKLFETVLGRRVLDYLNEVDTLGELLQKICEEFPNHPAMNLIVSLLNEYSWYDGSPSVLAELIEWDLRQLVIPREHLENRIECITKEQIFDKDTYYFLPGFNKENIPKIYKDESFLTDQEKRELGLFTSIEKNRIEKESWKSILSQLPNLTITYKEKSAFGSWNPSLLIEEMDFEVIYRSSGYQNSHIYNQVLLARYLDQLNKYGVIEKDLPILNGTYRNLPYMSYDNQFSGIEVNDLNSYLKGRLLLSYSSIDNFYRCGFRYYLSNILRVKPFESTFFTTVGIIFHRILEHALEPNFDFDLLFQTELEACQFKQNELTFLRRLEEEIKFDIKVLRHQKGYTKLKQELHEEKFYLPISKGDGLETTFMGVVDKIMFLEEDGNTYLAVVDYKTGSLPDNLNNIVYGIGMQLPIYLYLINKSHRFFSPKVVGIYLQKVIHPELRRQFKKNYHHERENNLKLVGYSLEDEEILVKLDASYENSVFIKSLRKGKNGFYKYAKVLNEEKFQYLENLVHKKIEEADFKIRNAQFMIQPKRIGKNLVGCDFCKYKDICFRREENIVSLKEYKNLDFLGGEEHA